MVGGFPSDNIKDALIVQPSFEMGQQAGLLDSHSQAQLNCIVKPFLSSPFCLSDVISSASLNQSLHLALSGNQLIIYELRQL